MCRQYAFPCKTQFWWIPVTSARANLSALDCTDGLGHPHHFCFALLCSLFGINICIHPLYLHSYTKRQISLVFFALSTLASRPISDFTRFQFRRPESAQPHLTKFAIVSAIVSYPLSSFKFMLHLTYFFSFYCVPILELHLYLQYLPP